jgi:hypothetical protein
MDPACFIPDPDPYIFHPGSGYRILGVKKHRIPDPTVYIKRGMKNKTNLFLFPYSFRNKFYK